MDTPTEPKNSAVVEAMGWIGAACILGAYALVSFGVLENTSATYQLLNLAGSGGLFLIAWRKRATQPALLNVVWALIAIIALVKLAL